MEEAIAKAGHHSQAMGSLSTGTENAPETREEQLVFALLELLDFECYRFEDSKCLQMKEEEVKEFLKQNKDEVREMEIPPTSFLGAIAGAFDFLTESKTTTGDSR